MVLRQEGVEMRMTLKMWFLAFVFIACIFAINPFGYLEKGVIVKSVNEGTIAADWLVKGEIIRQINGMAIENMNDYSKAVDKIFSDVKPVNWIITASGKDYNYESLVLGIKIDENLSIISLDRSASDSGLKEGMVLQKINGQSIADYDVFSSVRGKLEPKVRLEIVSDKGEHIFFASKIDFTVSDIPKTNLKAGLDLQGGAKALVKPAEKVSQEQLNEIIIVTKERLNVYGLADIVVRPVSDLSGNNYMLVEIAGATPKELEELIAKQGKFEAKIGNETVFIGGKNDITSVCRTDATCAGIRECNPTEDGAWCKFEFVIYLTEQAAKRQADITSTLGENLSSSGSRILSKTLDLYLDDKLVDSLQISADLKGKVATQIAISGPGSGLNQKEAYDSAKANMAKLQTVLITGSLPYKLEIVKLDSISPSLGKEFISNIFLASILAAVGVAIVIFMRYRNFRFILPMISISAAEIFITLGVAALIKWNLDLASIAGIIAAIGTGIDDQIVILDESRGIARQYSWKERIKRAFFIIFGAFSTLVVAMIPLWWAGAGMLRGFAVTTIIGVCIGVLITRPAFADIVSQINKD